MNKKIIKLGEVLFDQGWGFLVPYFLIYPFFWILNAKIQIAQWIFISLHVVNLFFFFCYLPSLLKRSWGWGILFWLCLFLFFLIPGAYLEYPSDPWEHFRRLFSWQSIIYFKDNGSFEYNKGGYFWGWTALFWAQPIDRRWALDLYSAFWQWLWVLQVFLFSKRLGFSKDWSYLQTLGFICFFGNNLFGIRYYALSTLPIAYIAYLRSLIIIMDFLDGKRRPAFALLVLFPVIFFNHFQEVVFFFLSGFVLILVSCYEKLSVNSKNVFNGVGWSFFGGSLAVWFLNFFPAYFIRIDFLHLSHFWKNNHIFFDALGIHGLISIFLAIVFRNRYRRLSLLTLTPIFLLIFPVSVYLIAHFILEPHTSYRIVYALPTSFMLVLGLKEGMHWLEEKIGHLKNEFLQYALVVGLLLVLAMPPIFPWRGRLFFQLYIPPQQRTLKDIDKTAQWLSFHRKLKYSELLFTDDLTDFALTTHLGWPLARPYWYHRLIPGRISTWLTSQRRLLSHLNERKNVRGVLVGMRNNMPPTPPSIIARMSGHWDQALGDLPGNIPEKFEKATETLLDLGWCRTFVPPFYVLYEPPEAQIKN